MNTHGGNQFGGRTMKSSSAPATNNLRPFHQTSCCQQAGIANGFRPFFAARSRSCVSISAALLINRHAALSNQTDSCQNQTARSFQCMKGMGLCLLAKGNVISQLGHRSHRLAINQ